MSDLPRWYALENERLRAWAHDERLGHGPLLLDAAAEIERLRDIISPGDAAAYEEGMAALLARCEAVEARLAEAHDLLALAAGVALLPSGVPALPLAIRERIAAWLRAQEPPR